MKLNTNQNKAIEPSTQLITSCENKPTNMATTPMILLLGERKNTLPPYSPIRFGVNTAHVNPQNTDSTAFHTLISSTF